MGRVTVLTVACWGVLASGVALADSPPPSTDQAILNQLTQLQKEIKALRLEVNQLRQAVTELGRSAGSRRDSDPRGLGNVDVSLGEGPRLGNANATVGIVEFTDYECPFCKRFHDQTFSELKKQYIDTGKIQYLVRNFPLDFHKQARGAAIAATCAGEQGAYWPVHHELFVNQRRLGPDLYKELATRYTLNTSAYSSCLKHDGPAKTVEADFTYGQRVGVRGTPSFFIGPIEDGKLVGALRVTGAQPLSAFTRVLDPLLQ